MAASSSANIRDIQILEKLDTIWHGIQFSNELNVHIHEERQLNIQIFKELEAISYGMQLINYKDRQRAKQLLEELHSFNCQILEKLAFCQSEALQRQQEDSGVPAPLSIHQQSPSSKPPIGNDSGQGNVRQDSRSACHQGSRKTSEGEKRTNQMRNAKLLCLLDEDSEFISESLNSDKHEAVHALGSEHKGRPVAFFLVINDRINDLKQVQQILNDANQISGNQVLLVRLQNESNKSSAMQDLPAEIAASCKVIITVNFVVKLDMRGCRYKNELNEDDKTTLKNLMWQE